MTIIYSDCGTDEDDHSTDISRLKAAHGIACNHNPDGTLCDLCNEFPEVESQIEDLHSRLKGLHERHRALRTKWNDVSNIISRFPFDIASSIFALCLKTDEEILFPYESTFGCRSIRTPDLPLKLSAVCRSWRRLVYSMPRLWSTLSINIYRANLQNLKLRFQSSGSAPLRVQLITQGNFASARAIPEVIMLVKQNFHRMARLCLNLSCQFIKEYLSEGLDKSNNLAQPILEELHVHCSEYQCLGPHNFPLSTNPPRLHNVMVHPCTLVGTQLDWNHVRHLCLNNGALIGQALSLLSEGKQLHVLDLLGNYCDIPSPLAGIIVTQNSIRNLRLFLTPSKILSHVTMPHLESLTLWETPCNSTNPIISFLQRSACSLTFMIWKPCGTLPEETVVEVFRCTPNLEFLFLSVRGLSVNSEEHVIPFLEHLGTRLSQNTESAIQIRNRSIDTFLPSLKSFVYSGPVAGDLLNRFLDVIETRSALSTDHGQVTQPLELMLFTLHTRLMYPTEPDLQRIMQLNAAGKRISVISSNDAYDDNIIDFSGHAQHFTK